MGIAGGLSAIPGRSVNLNMSADRGSGNNGTRFCIGACTLDLTYIHESIVRVRCTRASRFSEAASDICVNPSSHDVRVDVSDGEHKTTLSSGAVDVSLDKQSGSLVFSSEGEAFFKEDRAMPRQFEEIEIKSVRFDLESAEVEETVDGGRARAQAEESGEARRAWSAWLHFDWKATEAIYGLGSHEENVLNLRGTMQYLYQQNMKAVVPVLISSEGYGLLFEASCEMEFHDDESGSFMKLDAVDELVYYVIYGPEFDQIVAGYRALTGKVPMLPLWAFGFIQSRERYENQTQLIDTVKEYRKRNLPLDVIVQDWKYWPTGWGIKEFDKERYPDPPAMCEQIHAMNARLMLSIWPSIRGEHAEAEYMKAQGHMLGNGLIYDAYSKSARDEYWRYADRQLFRHGIDAWWCDCTEPVEADWTGAERLSARERRDINTNAQRQLLGRERINAYSLYHSKGIYENQRAVTESKRVVNLTRSSYAGQQRYATITWSGDISASWAVLAQQIACGLNFTATGSPYWTSDIGAFFVNNKSDTLWFWDGQFPQGCEDKGYRELYVRWFQYGAFLPLFRSHGTDTPRELWHYGQAGEIFYDTLCDYLDLRYRLLPYIYSLVGQTTQNDYTMLRLLAFDFRSDPAVYNIRDQYMFGPALMVAPVSTPMYYGPGSRKLERIKKTREVYLPAGADWYDFWSGQRYHGGQTIEADAPISKIPLFVRAGSLIPMGPYQQYSSEKPADPIELRIYPGEDGVFALYEDENDNYNYESGGYATVRFEWCDRKESLTVGQRKGEFPGMLRERTIHVVLVRDGSGIGVAPGEITDETVLYNGTPQVLTVYAE